MYNVPNGLKMVTQREEGSLNTNPIRNSTKNLDILISKAEIQNVYHKTSVIVTKRKNIEKNCKKFYFLINIYHVL